MSKIISVENLSFEYEKGSPILNNINFEIEKGSLIAILGRNGCGKTTLLDCLLGLNEIKTGYIVVDGKRIDDYSPKEYAKKVAYVEQNINLNIDYTVYEFISFGRNPYIGLFESLSEDDDQIIRKYASLCHIDHLFNKSINKISGGERQLALICRALVQESEILIFDEPTSSLDFGNQYKLFALLKELQKNGKTIIFTTHNPNQVAELLADVIVIDNGCVKVTGNSKEVISLDLLKELYDIDFIKSTNSFSIY